MPGKTTALSIHKNGCRRSLLLLVAMCLLACSVKESSVVVSQSEEIKEGFIDDDTIIIPASGVSRQGVKDRSRKEQEAHEAARMDAGSRLRQYCPIGIVSWESHPCADGSLHTPEIKVRMDAAQKKAELIKSSCKDEPDGAVACRAYYRFKIPGIKPLCDRALMRAQARCM